MTTEKIKSHLIECGFAPRSKVSFRNGTTEVIVSDEPTGKIFVRVSFYDRNTDTDLVLVVDMAASQLIEAALADKSDT